MLYFTDDDKILIKTLFFLVPASIFSVVKFLCLPALVLRAGMLYGYSVYFIVFSVKHLSLNYLIFISALRINFLLLPKKQKPIQDDTRHQNL